MRCEVPELKRCCFCFPLRYGLIVWSYFKLVVGLVAMAYYTMCLVYALFFFFRHGYEHFIIEIIISIIIFTIMMIDNVLYVVFIVSLHKKNYKIMRAYYIYLLIILGTTTVLFILLTGYQLYINEIIFYFYFNLQNIIVQFVFGFVNFVSQIYLILLVRSEFKKLSDKWQFRFENNAAEAQCVMATIEGYELAGESPIKSIETMSLDEGVHIDCDSEMISDIKRS